MKKYTCFLISQTVTDDRMFKNMIKQCCGQDLTGETRKPASDMSMFDSVMPELSLDLQHFTFAIPCSYTLTLAVMNCFAACKCVDTLDEDISILLVTFNLRQLREVVLRKIENRQLLHVVNDIQTILTNIGYSKVFSDLKTKDNGDGTWLLSQR